MTRPRTLRPVSRLIWREWKLPDVGRVTAVTPTAALLAQADGSWPGLRLRTDWHHHWRWTNLMEGMEERFGLVECSRPPGRPLVRPSVPTRVRQRGGDSLL